MPLWFKTLLVLSLVHATALAGDGFKESGAEFQRGNPAFLRAFREPVSKVNAAVVRVQCGGKDTALGIIVAADGLVVTKLNDLTEPIRCKLRDGRSFAAKIVGSDHDHDLALLKIDAKYLPKADFAVDEARVGQWVAAAGIGDNPAAIGVVSVATRKMALRAGQAYLGIGMEAGDIGLRVTQVVPDSAAQKAGLREGDHILTFNGKPTRQTEDLIGILSELKPGDVVRMTIDRDSSRQELSSRLGQRQPAGQGDIQNRLGSALSSRTSGYPVILQHDAVVRPEDCGSPLIDLDGKILGINISRAGRTETWAIPSDAVRAVLERLAARR